MRSKRAELVSDNDNFKLIREFSAQFIDFNVRGISRHALMFPRSKRQRMNGERYVRSSDA